MPKAKEIAAAPAHKGRPRAFDRDKALQCALNVFWQCGYEPASVAQLCAAMGINPPSLYAAFGNKAQLFLEAANYYEHAFWDDARANLETEPDVKAAITRFFLTAADILTSSSAPCGCLVVLAAINVSPESQPVIDALKVLRRSSREAFKKRLSRARVEGQLAPGIDIPGFAMTLHALIEGMSIQARDGASRAELTKIAKTVAALFPS